MGSIAFGIGLVTEGCNFFLKNGGKLDFWKAVFRLPYMLLRFAVVLCTIVLIFKLFVMTQAIQIRVDEKLKKEADLIFEDLGLDAPTAIRLFLRKVVVSKSIPFDLKSTRTDNGLTAEFEDEVLKISAEKDQIGPFKSAKSAITELHKHVG